MGNIYFKYVTNFKYKLKEQQCTQLRTACVTAQQASALRSLAACLRSRASAAEHWLSSAATVWLMLKFIMACCSETINSPPSGEVQRSLPTPCSLLLCLSISFNLHA
eukprot:TRINITY_DN9238_c0_g1_i1.p4 TRINITY_DN9238_c0_g1~~TRINITY_DN9238_c0_g1_i1.p4  ORF type:complete len:107 (-),score=24.91 TRINITY_DN9238_c0_g1_i1:1147-1467(-)